MFDHTSDEELEIYWFWQLFNLKSRKMTLTVSVPLKANNKMYHKTRLNELTYEYKDMKKD